MRALWILFLCLIGAGTAPAQDPAGHQAPPAVVILKLKWAKAIQSPFYDESSMYSATKDILPDPSRPNNAAVLSAPDSPFPPSGRFAVYYAYSVKIKNDCAKAIRGVAWEYLFADPASSKELGRHQFVSFEKIDAYESATLHGNSYSPPATVVSAEGLKKDKRAPFLERVEFKCVLYTDGTLWQHPAAQGNECEYLKRGEYQKKR